MIYTSYFANQRKIKKANLNIVSISRITPTWIGDVKDIKSLAPSIELLMDYKSNPNEMEYAKRYIEEVSVISATDVKSDEILCCFEKASDFCHRGLLRSLLSKHCILSLELKDSYAMFVIIDKRYDELNLSRNLSSILSELKRSPILISSKDDISYLADGFENVTYEPFTNSPDADIIVYFIIDNSFASDIDKSVKNGKVVIVFNVNNKNIIYDYMVTRADS